jgi:4-oxalocrotonate tautomerase
MPVVIIKMAKGRTSEQKKRLIGEINGTITSMLGVAPEMVTVLIDELEKENIGKAGKQLSETR